MVRVIGLGCGLGRIQLFVVHYCLRISSLSPSPMVSGRSGSSRHVRKLTLGFEKSTVTSETADVPPFLLAQIKFSR